MRRRTPGGRRHIAGDARTELGTTVLQLTAVMTIALGVAVHLGHLSTDGIVETLRHGSRDTLVSTPLILVGVLAGLEMAAVLRRRLRIVAPLLEVVVISQSIALWTVAVLVPGAVLHGRLLDNEAVTIHHALGDGAGVTSAAFAAALAAVMLIRVPHRIRPGAWTASVAVTALRTMPPLRRPDARRLLGLSNIVIIALLLASTRLLIPFGPSQPVAVDSSPSCDARSAQRTYDVTAINVVIPRNRWGDVDPHGQIFVLDQDKAAVRHWATPLVDPIADDPAAGRRLRPRPLVLRANEGECVAITLSNELGQHAVVPDGSPPAYGSVELGGEGLPLAGTPWVSLQINGVSFSVDTPGDGAIGYGADTGVAPGGRPQTYYLQAPTDEGVHFFRDGATLAGSEADGGSTGHGLYGAFVVEPAGARWFDPISRAELSTTEPYTEVAEQSGELYLDAIIVPPGTGSYAIDSNVLDLGAPDIVAFRETVQISQDEMPGVHLQNCDLAAADAGNVVDGRPVRDDCIDAHTTTPNSFQFGLGLGFNYAEEHLLLRQHEINRCPDCVGEETWLSSWPYGDPGLVKLASGFGPWYPRWHPWYDGGSDGAGANTGQQNFDNTDDPEDCGLDSGCYTANVPHSYQYDAHKIRFVHAGPKETHVFHMHAHQWLTDPQDIGASGTTPGTPDDAHKPEATTIDSQTYGPGEGFTIDLLFGAGSKPGTVGDSIFHCHLYPHFAEGFWSLFRVHDVLEDGTNTTPDGVDVRALQPLPDRIDAPSPASALDPGYPRFIPGEEGWRSPQPIDGVSDPIPGAVDDPGTIVREDLEPATRVVAGVGLEPPLQEITIALPPTEPSGPEPTYTLRFGGEDTDPLPVGASAEQVAAALQRLGRVGDVDVTGDGGPLSPYAVRFLILDNGDPVPTIQLELIPSAAGSVSAVWADDGPMEASATSLAYRLSLERAAVLQSHNDGIYDSSHRSNPWSPLAPAGQEEAPPDRYNKPGAPLVDPCPPGVREITYNASMVQLDITYNDNGWHDTQGRMLVLNDDLPAILAGTKPIEPFFFRANSGDCINFNMTNLMPNWFGNDDFLEMVQTNMAGQHIHLVKFDVTGSDGSSNGWNYQQAAFSEAQRLYDDAITSGDTLAAHPELADLGEGVQARCSPDLFDGADLLADGCRIALPPDWNPTWTCQSAGRCPVGQTISERWYVDYDLRTIFTHDHHFPAEDQNRGLFGALVIEPAGMDVRDSHTGEYKQPINDPSHGPACVDACNANAVGTRNDIIGPAADDDFREFSLAIQDFVSLYRPCSVCSPSVIAGQEPVAPPGEPELFPSNDPGVMGINYRNAPFVIRDSVGGVQTDPAHVFSSRVHGDPDTPVLEAYAGDPVRARLIQGAQEEQHVVQIHGMNWLQEPDDPESPRVNATPIGISEAFNFEMPTLECGADEDCVGDYLYGATATDDMWAGAWGLVRVYGKGVDGLLPLPDNPARAVNGNTGFPVSGTPPPKANKPGTPCPQDAPVRSYDVIAVDAPITYNSDGDNDPYGLVYAALAPGETPEQGAARIRSTNPDPMVLRAHEGECIEVTLTNKVDPAGTFATEHAPHGADQRPGANGFDPPLVLESPTGTPAGLRVSLHADLLRYDVRGSDGATVGFNRDQTVGPDDSITYRWYAYDVSPGELGAVNLTDYGDVRGHRHHGLFAGLVVEPRGATWADPVTGEVGTTGAQADIRVVDSSTEATDFREFVTFYQDGLNLRDSAGQPLPDPFDHLPTPEEPAGALADSEDRGEKALNYRNESFHHRLDQDPGAAHDGLDGFDLAHVFSSTEHGDPDTPIFRAYAGDEIRWRVLQGADKPRQHTFGVGGHGWLRQPNDDESETEKIGAQGAMSVGRAFNIHATAGGTTGAVGDFRYGDQVLDHKLSGGWWGLLRVYAGPGRIPATEFVDPDNPTEPGNAPILPLAANTVTVAVSTDHDGDGKIENDDGPADGTFLGLAVRVDGREYPVGANGRAHVPVTPGLVDLELTAGPDVAITGSASTTVDATHQGIAPTAEFTVTRLGEITVNVVEDPNGDDLADATGTLAGWSVGISNGSMTLPGTTGADGSVTFDGLLPGGWKVQISPPAGWKLTTSVPTVDLVENANETVLVGAARVAGVSLHLYNDADSSTAQDAGERNLEGWTVTASPLDPSIGQADVDIVTNAAGAATFEGLAAGTYSIDVQPRNVPAADWNITGQTVEVLSSDPQAFGAGVPECAVHRCTTQAFQASTTVMDVGFHNPSVWVTLRLFDDSDNDGVRDTKETKLTGFPVEIWRNGTRTATSVVGNNGAVSHYGLPGAYSIRIQEPAGNGSIHWFGTPVSASTSLAPPGWQSVAIPATLAGDSADISVGAIQPGTVSARVFHDRDGDGIWNDLNEESLGGRPVRLYGAKGSTKTPLATAFTNSSGMATFQVGASTDFRLEVLTPAGWLATTPLGSNGAGTVAAIRSDSNPALSASLVFGQREVVDTTPPPTPVADPPGGSHVSSVQVGLTSETGAQIRYRLDGGDPTVNGVTYAGPLTLGVGTWELRAVAYDISGNRSGILAATYTVTDPTSGGAPDATLEMSALQILDAQSSSGDARALAVDDGVELALTSRRQGKNEITAFEASGSVDVGTVTQLDISFAPHQTASGITQRLLLRNLQTATWESVWSTSSPTSGDAMIITVSGDPNRFVSSTGELRARVESQTRLTSHQMGVDLLWFALKQS